MRERPKIPGTVHEAFAIADAMGAEDDAAVLKTNEWRTAHKEW
jgi:hypothetical protein